MCGLPIARFNGLAICAVLGLGDRAGCEEEGIGEGGGGRGRGGISIFARKL